MAVKKGALETLVETLANSPLLQVTHDGHKIGLLFGEENIEANLPPPPRIVLVADGGTYEMPKGYIGNARTNPELPPGTNSPRSIATDKTIIEAHVWGVSKDVSRQQPIHHANETELLREQLVQAFHGQMFNGYFYKAINHKPVKGNREIKRLGRTSVLLIEAWFPVTLPPDTEVVLANATIVPTIEPYTGQ